MPYAGSWREAGFNHRAAVLNRPLQAVAETYHEGPFAGEYRGVRLSSDTVDLLAIKRAEDGNGHILRLAETTGSTQPLRIDLPLLNRTLDTTLTAWEIKTLFLPENADEAVREVLITEY